MGTANTQGDLELLVLFKSKCANKEVTKHKQQKTKPHTVGYVSGPKNQLEDLSNAKAGRTGGTKKSTALDYIIQMTKSRPSSPHQYK